jgi:hypothetical protein
MGQTGGIMSQDLVADFKDVRQQTMLQNRAMSTLGMIFRQEAGSTYYFGQALGNVGNLFSRLNYPELKRARIDERAA